MPLWTVDCPCPAFSQVLVAFIVEFDNEFERNSEVSLAICANVLRLVGDEGVRVRDLPRLAGLSKESIAMALSFLEKRHYVVVVKESPGSRVKILKLTERGQHAREASVRRVWSIEQDWKARFWRSHYQRASEAT